MALHTFDKRLLELMYFLTKNQKLMGPSEIARRFSTEDGKRYSERTIKRWLKFLKKEYFVYYPIIKHKKIGLRRVILLLNSVKDSRILDLIPYKTYVMMGVDLKTLENSFFTFYWLPEENIKDFKRFWEIALQEKLIGSYNVAECEQAIAIYSPFHKIVDKQGRLDFSKKIELNNNLFIELLAEKLKQKEIDKDIKNPFIVPLLLEYFNEYTSSRQVWFSFKRKMGESIWNYVKDIKVKGKRTNGVGINYVQKIMKYLHKDFDSFFQQARITYSPLYVNEGINLILDLKIKNKKNLFELTKQLSKCSLYVIVYQLLNKPNRFFFSIITNSKEAIDILTNIIPKHIYESKNNRTLWINYDKSSNYWEKHTKNWLKSKYHELFNPRTASWKYDSKKYLEELDKIK